MEKKPQGKNQVWWDLLNIFGNVAFMAMQFFLMFLVGFGAVIAGMIRANKKGSNGGKH